MKKWGVFESENGQSLAVVPIDDIGDHVEFSLDCACEPKMKREGKYIIIAHNAYDKREEFETGAKYN